MKKVFSVFVLGAVLAVGSVPTLVSAQSSTGRGGSRWSAGPEPMQRDYKGFCYSGRKQTCTSIFARTTEAEISQECRDTGWHKYFAFQSGRDAKFQYDQVCRH
jgi:hypothetical protein